MPTHIGTFGFAPAHKPTQAKPKEPILPTLYFTIGMSFKQEIDLLIKERREVYKISSNDLISSYTRDNKIAKDYSGREILEMLQNADDAGANELLLHLDTKNQTILIANTGTESFTIKGIRSLLISDLSGKTKIKYIGNKGLGFRSLLNWSENISIKSNNVIIKFSPEIARAEFEKLYDSTKHNSILTERDWDKSVIPMSILSIPQAEELIETSVYKTEILIKYKKDILGSIEEQLAEIDEKTLLFLNSVKKIVIKHNSDVPKEIEPDTKWKIYSSDEKILPNKYQDNDKIEDEFYNIKLAIDESLTNVKGKLFTYLPTNISFDFPFILHGTFELDSSRKHLKEESKKNEFILSEAANLIVKSVKQHFEKEVSWKIFKYLTYNTKNEELEKLGFYLSIDKQKKELEIYPCIDNKYRKINDVKFISNEFAQFLIDSNNTNIFPEHLQPLQDDIKINRLELKQYDSNTLFSRIENLSKKIKDLDHRTNLIHIAATEKLFHLEKRRYSLLINNKNKLIDKDVSVYTPKSKGEDELKWPEFVNLDFLNKNLYEKLLEKFGLTKSEEKSRELQRILKGITNVQSYEPVPVIEKIISGTNSAIKNNTKKRTQYIQEMIKSLFIIKENNIDEKTKIPETSKIQVLNKVGSLIDIKNCFLSQDYPSGKLTEELFVGVYKRNQFLADRKKFGLQKEDSQVVEDFFLWLGINKHTKFIELTKPTGFENFVFKKIETPHNYRDSFIKVKAIEYFENIISSLTKEKFVLWILKDSSIKKQLDYNNEDIFKYNRERETYNSFYYQIQEKPSYILYQFLSKNVFKDYIIGGYNIPVINPFEFNFDSFVFKIHNINKRDIENVLLKIGAIETFNELSIERVNEILKSLPEKDLKGNYSQRIYKLAIEHYKNNNKLLPNTDDLFLFAKKGNVSDYYKNTEVYYSDNITLPKKIIENKAILNLPRRSGEKQISSFFKTKTFTDLKPTLSQPIELNINLTEQFNNYFKEVKPFLLAHRLNKLDKEKPKQKEEEARLIKNTVIKIYRNCGYEIEGKIDELEHNDFINDEKGLHIKCKNYSSEKDLKNDSGFCDAFAEIICISLKVSEQRNEFRFDFKNDLKDTEHSIINDLGKDILDEARNLLGMSDYEKLFWQIIFKLKSIEIGTFKDNEDLNEKALSKLKIDITNYLKNINYKDLADKSNYNYLKELFEKLNLEVNKFNTLSGLNIDFTEHHLAEFKNYILDNEKQFKNSLWHYLCINNSEQNTFLDKIFSFQKDYLFFIDKKMVKYKNEFVCPYSEILQEYSKSKFSILINVEFEQINYEEIMNKNISYIGCNKSDLNGQNKLLSLLCFEGNNDIVKNSIKDDMPDVETAESTANESTKEYDIVDSTLTKPENKQKGKKNKKGKGKGGAYNPNRDKLNRQAGAIAERQTYNKLVAQFGKENVDWVSGNSEKPDGDDNAGYDIKYKNVNKEWKYVEVKSVSSDYFYLSTPEREFGENNASNYELALVKDNIIHFIKDFFIFSQEETFENNSKYLVDENDYIVYVEIKSEDN